MLSLELSSLKDLANFVTSQELENNPLPLSLLLLWDTLTITTLQTIPSQQVVLMTQLTPRKFVVRTMNKEKCATLSLKLTAFGPTMSPLLATTSKALRLNALKIPKLATNALE